VRFTDFVSLSWWPFSYRAGTRGSGRRREFQHAPVMLRKCLVHTPFAMPDSFLPLVVCVLHLLRQRRDFTDFCDAVNRCLATEGAVRTAPVVIELPLFKGKRKLKAAWTWMAPLSKVMSVTSSGGDYFGHRRYKSVEPQGPTELHKGVSTAGCSRGMRARNLRGQTRAGARAESQHGVQVAPATEGWAVQRGGKRHDSIVARNVA
jgi:hypothetical protein